MTHLEELLRQGRVREAKSEAERTLKQDPVNTDAQLTLAKVYLFERNLVMAETFLHQAEKNGETSATRLLRANLHAQQGQYQKAKEILEALVREPDPAAESSFQLGVILAQEGQAEAALPQFERAIAKEPHQGVFHFHLALALTQLEREPKRVFDHLLKAIEYAPVFAASYALLSRILSANGKLAEARTILEEGLKAIPGDPSLTTALTNVSLLQGDVGTAFQSAASLAKQYPDDPEIVSNFANLLLAQQRFGEVLQVCISMDAKGKTNATLKMIEATALEAQKPPELDGAVRCYEQAMALDPADWRAANNLGQLLLRRQDGDVARFVSRAVTVLEEALRRKPGQVEPKLNLALAYLRANQKDKSAKLAQELVALGLPAKHPVRDQAERLVAALKRG